MQVVSINVGRPAPIEYNGRTITTSILKKPVSGPVFLRTLNLDGDEQSDLRVHGGRDKAIFAMSLAAYDWWRERGGQAVALGTIGENLSVAGLREDEMGIGDVYALGEAKLQVSEPRFPCSKVVAILRDGAAGKKMIASKMPGVYFRVLQEGLVEAGQSLALVEKEKTRLSVLELFLGFLQKDLDPGLARAALSIQSLTPHWRGFLESRA